MLKGQDILVLLKLVARSESGLSFLELAHSLGMSSSEVHASVKRAAKAGLIQVEVNSGASHRKVPNRHALLEFLIHGLKYVFPPEHGGETRGMPTGLFAVEKSPNIVAETLIPVWPDSNGKVRGYAFTPLFRSAPTAAANDEELYELLALVDAIRGGNARERKIATEELTLRLTGNSK